MGISTAVSLALLLAVILPAMPMKLAVDSEKESDRGLFVAPESTSKFS